MSEVELLEVGERLKSIMDERGVSQNELARRTGLSPQSIGLYCRGDGGMTLGTAARVADALGVSIDTLAGRE